jgi:5'-3' exonuclease
MAQCVIDDRVVLWDRRKDVVYDADAVVEKFGVRPASIPDYLALVGDSADGFPGLPGWGAKSAAKVLFAYDHLEQIPTEISEWNLDVRGASKLVRTLCDHFDEALLFRRIATLESDSPTITSVDELEWTGPRPELVALAESIDAPGLVERAVKAAEALG